MMKLIYTKQNSRRGKGEFQLSFNGKTYPAPKTFKDFDYFKMGKASRPGYAICREMNIEPTISILNYIRNIETNTLKNIHKHEIEEEHEKIKTEKIKCILNRYIGTIVHVYNVSSSFHYDYDFKIYSTELLSILELDEKLKHLGEVQYNTEITTLSDNSINGGYFFLDRYRIDLIDRPY